MWPFNRKKRWRANDWSLSRPLYRWSDSDAWTIGDACLGTQIWGSTGSGKSTGSLAGICRAFLRAGFGGIFLTAKPEDRDVYLRYCREENRLGDVLLFGPDHALKYNFIDAELHRTDAGGGIVENLTMLLATILEINDRKGSSGRDEEGFWRRATLQLSHEAISLLVLAKGKVTIPDLYRLVVSAPVSVEQLRSEDWKRSSFCWQCLTEADARPKTARQLADFELTTSFFMVEWAGLSDRTRSVVLSSFSSMVHALNRGVARDLLSSPVTNVTPEMTQLGALIVLDMAIKLYGDVGRMVQVIFKYCFQRAQERRNIAENPRPTFLVCDESHLFAVSADQVFQTTARSSRTCTVYATQSISNYLAAFGGEKSEPEVHSLLGNLQNQVFHQQTDTRTNTYAAELIGRSRQFLTNSSSSYGETDWLTSAMGFRGPGQTTGGVSEQIDFEVQPKVFTSLRRGGPENGWLVEGIVYQGGARFRRSGKTWLRAGFSQRS
jgi:hypothetical protein